MHNLGRNLGFNLGKWTFYKHNMVWLLLSALTIVLDQWTKSLAVSHLPYGEPLAVLPVLNWTLSYNSGAAFSMLQNAGGWQRYLFTCISLFASVLFIGWLLRIPKTAPVLAAAIALVLGGALGNLIDRSRLGYVIDFIHTHYLTHSFPIFNLADSAITLGAFLLLLDILFLEKKRQGTGHE